MMRTFRQTLAVLVSWCLLSVQLGMAQTPPQPPQAAQQNAEQLQQLVAPIALYPDALIAQILPAATYPEQIVEAQQFMQAHPGVSPEQLATGVDGQKWDVSVKALTQFPAVLANMNLNLAWTSELGDAYINQRQDVTQAIQTMRERAKQAGNLQSTQQQQVKQKGQTIVVEPAEPNVVYVPQYDPWLAYGDPLAVFPGGIHIRDFSWKARESALASDSALAYSPVSAGDGTIGALTGVTAAGFSLTTTHTSHTARQ